MTGRYAAPPTAIRWCDVTTTVAEIFETMEYGPAPEASAAGARVAAARTAATSASSSAAKWVRPRPAKTFETINPATGQALARVAQAGEDATSTRRCRGARGASRRGRALGGHARARHLYALARGGPEALAPARGAGDPRQRQADPRDARHRHPARRAPLLPSCRLGAADGERVRRATGRSASSGRSSRGTSRC